MSEGLISKRIGEILRMSAEELKDILPLALDEIDEYGIGKTLEEAPDLLSKIIGKLVEIDAAKFLSEVPEISDKFMDFLWEGIGVLAAKSEELRSVLAPTREINVNLEASDSPLRGHFIVSQGKLSGGSGLLHFKDEDFKYLGPTEVLMRLLSSELDLSSRVRQLLTEGHSGFAPLLAPIMRGISELIKGKQ